MAGLFAFVVLTGCFGEDYDVGVPTAHLSFDVGQPSIQLSEANISWKTASEDVQQTVDDIQKFGLLQNEIRVTQNQTVSLDFKENEKNGGDIWTDSTITVTLWKDGEKINM